MRLPWLSFALVACAPAARPPSDAPDLKARSHSFLEAYDRVEESQVNRAIGADFTLFDSARLYDRERLGRRMRLRGPVTQRFYADEQVHATAGGGIYIGESTVEIPAKGSAAARREVSWQTLVWTREGDELKVAHWQIQKGGTDAAREEWNSVYRESGGFQRAPNRLLLDTVKYRPVGAALDLGMGQGRNSIALATAGWKVTGVDISDVGVRIARDEALKRHLVVDAIDADLTTWDMGRDRWDLVAMIYAGSEPATIERAKASLRKGGVFVFENFYSDRPQLGPGVSAGELAARFGGGFRIVRDEVVTDFGDWSETKTKLQRFVAEKL
ncbi:hypothetical protein BH11MYX4_BH11MYX4_27340 [soil metagenome]